MSGLSSSSSLFMQDRSSSMGSTITRQGGPWSLSSRGRTFRQEEYVNDPQVWTSESRRRRHVTSTRTHPVDPDSVKEKMEAQLDAAQAYIDRTIEQHRHHSRRRKTSSSKNKTVPVVIHHQAPNPLGEQSPANDHRSERSSMPSTPALERLATPDISDVDDDWDFCSCSESNRSRYDFVVVDHPHDEGCICLDCEGHGTVANHEVSFGAKKRSSPGLPRLGLKIT